MCAVPNMAVFLIPSICTCRVCCSGIVWVILKWSQSTLWLPVSRLLSNSTWAEFLLWGFYILKSSHKPNSSQQIPYMELTFSFTGLGTMDLREEGLYAGIIVYFTHQLFILTTNNSATQIYECLMWRPCPSVCVTYCQQLNHLSDSNDIWYWRFWATVTAP